jgi:uncharacterized protein
MSINNKINYILAHGAGAPCNSQWMNHLSEKIKERSCHQVNVIRFNFNYMDKRKLDNKKYPPSRMPQILSEWVSQIEKYKDSPNLFIGGKSMGGRASTLLDFNKLPINVNGIINFGFPFHAPGKGPESRISHLKNFNIPCLINQGERDPMGTKAEVESYELSDSIKVKYLEDGNHDLKPRVRSGRTINENLDLAVDHMLEFIEKNLS